MTSFISPYRVDREKVRDLHEEADIPFLEIFTDTPIDVCEKRDPKGLYRRARSGEVKMFTGVDDPYEVPKNAEVRINTTDLTPDEAAQEILLYLGQRGYI